MGLDGGAKPMSGSGRGGVASRKTTKVWFGTGGDHQGQASGGARGDVLDPTTAELSTPMSTAERAGLANGSCDGGANGVRLGLTLTAPLLDPFLYPDVETLALTGFAGHMDRRLGHVPLSTEPVLVTAHYYYCFLLFFCFISL
jgi:hypothetical protein